MKWFDRWFTRKCQEAWNDARHASVETRPIGKNLSIERSLGDNRQTMNIQVHCANGGYVLEFTRYHRTRDDHERNLHIITEQQNLGEAIAQIITVEMLRN